jgi:uncharacterized protein (UPF0248 family)
MNGTELLVVKELLGHKSVVTTEIYTHVQNQQLQQAVNTLEPKKPFFERLLQKLLPKREAIFTAAEKGDIKFIVGREKQMRELIDCSIKKINVLVKGNQGTGKSHLLDNLKIPNQKILRIDEFSSTKNVLVGMLIEILNKDKKELKATLFGGDDFGKKITKESIKNLTEMLINYTEKQEYTIIVDDVERVTPTGIKALEKLNKHFHLICGARKVSISKATFLTNFQVIKLENLKRHETLEIVNRLSYSFVERIEDYEMYKNHIVEQSNGNPQFIIELVERFEKELVITQNVIRGITHSAAYKEIDMSIPILIGLSSLMVLRYLGREVGDTSL